MTIQDSQLAARVKMVKSESKSGAALNRLSQSAIQQLSYLPPHFFPRGNRILKEKEEIPLRSW